MKLTKNELVVLSGIYENSTNKPNEKTINSLEKKGLIRKVFNSWMLTPNGLEIYKNIIP